MNLPQSECQCDVPLYDMEQNNIGNLDIMLNLEDNGPYYRIKKKAPSKFFYIFLYILKNIYYTFVYILLN